MHKYTVGQMIGGEIVESAVIDYTCISEKYKARVTDVLCAAGDV